RLVVLHVGGRERPADDTTCVERGVPDEDLLVIPVEEGIEERGREQNEDHEGQRRTNGERQPRRLEDTRILFSVFRVFVFSWLHSFSVRAGPWPVRIPAPRRAGTAVPLPVVAPAVRARGHG